MKALDLFCGAGGASMGLHRAGYEVVGVDIKPQPRYPFEFHQGDAMEWPLEGFDLIWASPPCQLYSVTASLHDNEHPDLVGDVRDRLDTQRCCYVIENVEGAPLFHPFRLCGSAFGLGVRRHRWFETMPWIMDAMECRHALQPEPIDVTGTGGPRRNFKRMDGKGGCSRKPGSIEEARTAMGIDWMTRAELAQAIPPAYAEWIGRAMR